MSDSDNIFHKYRQHNPFWKEKAASYTGRREALFYKPKVYTPGYFSKLSIGFVIGAMIIGIHEVKKFRTERDRSKAVAYEFKRKSVPFLQAVEDRKFLAVEHRRKLLLESLFTDSEEYHALMRHYNDTTVWPGAGPERAFLHFGGTQRSYKNTWRHQLDYLNGSDGHMQNRPEDHY